MTDTNPYRPPEQVPDRLAFDLLSDQPSLNAVRRITISTGLTFLSGIASHYARRISPTSPHLDALFLLAFLVLVSLWLVYWCSKFSSKSAYKHFHVALAGCWWGGIAGWELSEFLFPKFQYLVDDICFVLGLWHFGAAALGSFVIFVLHKIFAKRRRRSATQQEFIADA